MKNFIESDGQEDENDNASVVIPPCTKKTTSCNIKCMEQNINSDNVSQIPSCTNRTISEEEKVFCKTYPDIYIKKFLKKGR